MSENPTEKQSVPVSQRKGNRFQLDSTPLTLIQIKFFGIQKQEFKAALVNLSEKGLQVLSKIPLDPGDIYKINFFVPGVNVTLSMSAKVVWSNLYKKDLGKNYYRAGFKFTKLSKEVEKQLKELNPK
jgi:c-di-GMP-binding flagellar brake protein YcgR